MEGGIGVFWGVSTSLQRGRTQTHEMTICGLFTLFHTFQQQLTPLTSQPAMSEREKFQNYFEFSPASRPLRSSLAKNFVPALGPGGQLGAPH